MKIRLMGQNLKRTLGTRLRALRRERSLTQEQVAEAVGRTVETISNIERGVSVPSLETLEGICRVLQVPVADMLAVPSTHQSPERDAREAVVIDQIRQLSDADLSVAEKTIAALAGR